MKLLLLFAFFLFVSAEREYLKEDRHIHWLNGDSNHGPYYGQPEQTHLAFDGKHLILPDSSDKLF